MYNFVLDKSQFYFIRLERMSQDDFGAILDEIPSAQDFDIGD